MSLLARVSVPTCSQVVSRCILNKTAFSASTRCYLHTDDGCMRMLQRDTANQSIGMGCVCSRHVELCQDRILRSLTQNGLEAYVQGDTVLGRLVAATAAARWAHQVHQPRQQERSSMEAMRRGDQHGFSSSSCTRCRMNLSA